MTNFHVLKKTQVSTSERSFSALRCLKAYTLGTDSSPVISLCLSSPRGVWWERGNRGRVAQRHKNDWGQVSLRNTMKQDWLNICLLVYCHKTLADATDPVAITKTFASANNKSLFKTRNKVRGRLNWDISFFFIGTHSPTTLWKAILCSFCCRHHWRLHPKSPNEGLDEGGGAYWGGGVGNMECPILFLVPPPTTFYFTPPPLITCL